MAATDNIARGMAGRVAKTKVDKVPGKGLSTNDFTDADKQKLDAITNPMQIVGRVDTVADLDIITPTPAAGSIYLVGLESDPDKEEYVYTEEGTWEYLGAHIPVDTELSTTSTNPVQNRIVTAAVNEKLKAIAAAAAYDPSHTYVTGEYMTYEGEFYRCDPTGAGIPSDVNLFDPVATKSAAGYLNNAVVGNGEQTGYNDFYISGIIPITNGGSYTIYSPNAKHYNYIYEYASANGAWADNGSQATSTDEITFTNSNNYSYIKITVQKSTEDQVTVKGLSSSKFVKTTIADELKNITDNEVGQFYPYNENGTTYIGEIFNDYTNNETRARYAHAEGQNTKATGHCGHAEGYKTTAHYHAHAEGDNTTATGDDTHAEGTYTNATGNYAHAEGYYSTASGDASHSEGSNTTASGADAHAEGNHTTASSPTAHAEGSYTTASAQNAHAEGASTTANGINSHAQNLGTIAKGTSQTALGKFNVQDDNNTYAVVIGNGTADNARSNAATVDWNGNVNIAGAMSFVNSTAAMVFKTADVYNASTGTYAVKDTCVESGILYVCKTAVTVAEAFDSSKWDTVTNPNGLFYIQPITTAAHTALLAKDPNTFYAII